MGRPIKKGSTDQSITIYIMDSTTGAPETGVDYNTSGIDLWYRRQGATKTSITEATLAALDSAHSDGGVEPISDGFYRLDLPDAACASAAGVNEVTVGGTITGMIVVGDTFPLVAYDPYDAVRMGMTALPNAAADAAGGLPISDAGALDLDAKLANTNEVTAVRMATLTDWINGGRLDLLIDAIKVKTDYLPSAAAGASGGVFIAGSNAATSITTALTANLTGNVTGNLSGSVGSVTGAVGSVTGTVGSVTGAVGSVTGSVGGNVTGSVGSLAAQAKADVNAEVDSALNTAIPGSPTADSINERIVAIDAYGAPPSAATIKTTMEGAGGHLALILEDTGTTVPAVLGAPVGASLSADIAAVKSDSAAILEDTGTTLDGIVDAILVDTDDLQTNQGDWATATGFSTHDAADVKTALEASGSVLWKALSAVNNKMNVNEADGTVALRNIGDTGTIATGSVTSSSGTTTRLELTWAA